MAKLDATVAYEELNLVFRLDCRAVNVSMVVGDVV